MRKVTKVELCNSVHGCPKFHKYKLKTKTSLICQPSLSFPSYVPKENYDRHIVPKYLSRSSMMKQPINLSNGIPCSSKSNAKILSTRSCITEHQKNLFKEEQRRTKCNDINQEKEQD